MAANPLTQQRLNRRFREQAHSRVSRCALFDPFPYAHPMESGMLLARR
ncbi:hypothetical protein [Pseudomonas sp. UBA1879]